MAACPNCGQNNPETARFCHACATPLTAATGASREVRKTVTVVFCDVIDSTPLGERLDPELLRRVMSRFFDEMRAALEAHGGTVEKFIGDAVMAVFGVPRLHEDDALRAARAAVEMRQRLAGLNEELARSYGVRLEMRVGINTGPVVAGGPGALTLATGDAVNLAKRLEQAAEPGEILIGAETYRLVRDEVDADRLESFSVKGKREEVAAWRLHELRRTDSETAERRTLLVDREADLRALLEEFDDAVADSCARLVTVFGSAGIGKSRLASELLDRLGDQATSLTGRCLPYGDGITFWPLAEMIREAGGESALRAALAGRSDADLVVERVLGATGSAGEAGGAEETFWAMRKLRDAAGTHLMALVRKELVEPEASTLPQEDAFRFRHVLIRDAAYEGMPKGRRAHLHERFGQWLEENAPERASELEEIVGYHLEQAVRLREQLGSADESTRALAARAGEILGAAGRRAVVRSDMPAAINLLGRALELGGAEQADRHVLLRELSAALWAQGELTRAATVLEKALAAAIERGDRRIEWYARLDRSAHPGLAGSGNTALLASPALMLAEMLLALGRDDEAGHFVDVGKAAPSSDDTTDAVLACSVEARLRARDGELAEAEAEARRAVELASGTDALVLHGDALALLAEVLVQAERPDEAHEAYERAIELYSQKGNVVAAQRAADAVAAVSQQAP